jgi:glycolate oxidase iron-sulfur subunit
MSDNSCKDISLLTAGDRSGTTKKALAYEETFGCIQCGYCLPACPTYETMGKETHSPRGRINLVKMAAEEKLTDLSLLSDSIDKCLGCRACETACPTGVPYGTIFESAKNYLQQNRPQSRPVKGLRKLMFERLFPSKGWMNALGNAAWLYQKSGLQGRLTNIRLIRRLLGPLALFEPNLPSLPSPMERGRRPVRWSPKRGTKFKVAFFTGCVMDAVFERTNYNSMRLLQEAGCEVVQLANETCCGALHAHAGELKLAEELAKRNIAAYEQLSAREHVDYIVNNAGGCGAMLVEYGHLLREQPEWAERAQAFSAKVKDISQVLAWADPLPFHKQGAESRKELVTYQRSCHMTNVQKVVQEPLQLLKSIPGIELREMKDKDKCCGSAGIYNIVNYEESMDILDVKMSAVKQTGAVTIVTTNPGCLLQMQLGISREGLQQQLRAVHLVDYLAEACGIAKGS